VKAKTKKQFFFEKKNQKTLAILVLTEKQQSALTAS
jgi:hypothetical protein